MSKWYGTIGYVEQVQTSPGVWSEEITERKYSGDLNKINSRWLPKSDSTNDDLTINNQLSIVADPFAYQNFHSMKYAEFMGAKWKITNVDASQRPRLILMLGGVYNE